MQGLEIDGWVVNPRQGRISRHGEVQHLEPLVMDLLVFLASRAGEVCTREEILEEVWPESFVGDAALHSAVYALRKAFGENAKKPRILETIPRRGYRLIGEVSRARSIAVLPLDNLTRDPDEDYFADGLTEALISELGRCEQLSVTSRQTIMAYRERRSPLPEVAAELGVELLVEGSVLRVGDRARLTIQLIEAERDRHLWSESYERELGDIFALQRELGIADLWGARAYWGLAPSTDVIPKSIEATERALSKDPGSAEAWAIRGFNELYMRRDYEAAEKDLRHALGLNASSVTAHLGIAICLIALGRPGEAEHFVDRGIQLDPLNPAMIAVRAMLHMSRLDATEAEGALGDALAVEPSHRLSNQLLADLLWADQPERAVGHEQLWWQPDPDLGSLFAADDARLEPRAALDAAATLLVDRDQHTFVQPTAIARLHAHAGDDEAALDWLERAERERDLRLVDSFRLAGPWDRLRDSSRFRAIGVALGLPDYR